MASDSRKRLALAIIDFLSSSLQDGTLQPEDADNVEIASNCISDAFGVDPSDETAMKDALGGQNLLSIYGVYEKLKGKGTSTASASSSAGAAAGSAGTAGTDASKVPAEGQTGGPTPESEKLKGQGNAALQRKDYPSAIDFYTKALEISPLNPIYLSNRAAAFSADGQHELAKNDAELATATDPKYTKAWSRLGLARFALGDARGAMEAYEQGIEAEGNGGSDAMKKGLETARKKVQEEEAAGAEDDDVPDDIDGTATARSADAPAAGGGGMPDLAGLASMLGGGGAGGGGGMPDLSSIMQNPMLRNMAQNLMSNPEMMNNIMNNPQLRNMASRFGGGGGAGAGGTGGTGGGGGMPNFSEMMNDPAIAEMARSFMGGMGGAGGSGAGRGAGSGGTQ